jgi:tRNA threonylcarbamoyladenosine biosynthesis protein TsaB
MGMRILALDTSMEACSVALYDAAGGNLLSEVHAVPGRGHAELLFAQIEAVTSECGFALDAVDRFAVTVGPGSFTGVRVGLAAARGLALAARRPLIGIGTLEAMAAEIKTEEIEALIVAVDARRGELYVEAFTAQRSLCGPFVAAPMAAARRICDLTGCALAIAGSGAEALTVALATFSRNGRIVAAEPWPRARVVARLSAGRTPQAGGRPGPVYLRAPDAKPPGAMGAKCE